MNSVQSLRLQQTDPIRAGRSPLTIAARNGIPRQLGTRYSNAGWAALKKCMTPIVVSRPSM